jgi:hypothetical protein
MVKTYKIKNADLVIVLNKLEELVLVIKRFVLKHHSDYSYDTSIDCHDNIWTALITITDENKDYKVLNPSTTRNEIL